MVYLTLSEYIWLKNTLFTMIANDPKWESFSDDAIDSLVKTRIRELEKTKNSLAEIEEALSGMNKCE